MWVFLFSFQAYQLSVFVTRVKASYMFNKANYFINFIHKGIILTVTVQVYWISPGSYFHSFPNVPILLNNQTIVTNTFRNGEKPPQQTELNKTVCLFQLLTEHISKPVWCQVLNQK